MSSLPLRSRGGCLTCKSKHKKCDETNPNCQRCERSGLECSGYAFLSCDAEGKTVKLSTNPRSTLPKQRGAAQIQSCQRVTMSTSAGFMEERATVAACGNDSDLENLNSVSHSPFKSTEPTTSIEDHRTKTTTGDAPQSRSSYPADCMATARNTASYGPTKIFSYSTTQHRNMMIGSQLPFPLPPNHSRAASPSLDPQRSEAGYGHVRRVLFGSLVLDRNTESNSLPFVLESFATWIHRTAFDTAKVARRMKCSIVERYTYSAETRCITILLANLIRRSAKSRLMSLACTPECVPILSALQKQVRRRISLSQSVSHSGEMEIRDAAMILDDITFMILIFACTSNVKPGLELMGDAASIFRRAYSHSPRQQIHLQTLLLEPMGDFRTYVTADILTSIMASRSMIFQYDTSLDPGLGLSVLNFSEDAGIHWGCGIPDQLTLIFARINMLRETLTWDQELIDEMETILRDFVPVLTVSNEPDLNVGKAAVQESWRQAAYIYLYMGLCGASSNDPRVMEALSRFLNVLKSVKRNHSFDVHIRICFVIAGIAARDKVDRDFIRYRMVRIEECIGKEEFSPERLEQLWERVDAENRPAIWADLVKAHWII